MPLHTIENILLIGSVLLLLSVFASKLSDKFSVPALAIFLTIGMLAGSEGIGRIYFDNARLANSLGIAALSFILFSGGLGTDFQATRRVFPQGLLLATAGVFITALITGAFAVWILNFSFIEGLLLGAIVSSTDAAAVFSILRSKNIGLKGRLKPLLEFESGSNDPMAVFLTVGFIQLIQNPELPWPQLLWFFTKQMSVGALAGIVMAHVMINIINRLTLEYEGLYPVLTFAFVLFTYSATSMIGGSGFLAVYLVGLILSGKDFIHKRSLARFHEGLGWLMQITMFLTLGLLVFPSRLLPVALNGIAISLVLFLVARPISVFLCIPFARLREKTLISWVGLRGAAPIILATFPLLAGIQGADMIFNIVFFVVVLSVLIQGTTIAQVSRLLGLNTPIERRSRPPIEFEQREGVDADLVEFIVPYGGSAIGKPLYKLNLPQDSLVVLIGRSDKFVVAKGSTALEAGDIVLVLVNKRNLEAVKAVFSELKE